MDGEGQHISLDIPRFKCFSSKEAQKKLTIGYMNSNHVFVLIEIVKYRYPSVGDHSQPMSSSGRRCCCSHVPMSAWLKCTLQIYYKNHDDEDGKTPNAM